MGCKGNLICIVYRSGCDKFRMSGRSNEK
jgi:hypothetical protein